MPSILAGVNVVGVSDVDGKTVLAWAACGLTGATVGVVAARARLTTGLLALPTETRGEANAGAGTMHEVPTPEPYRLADDGPPGAGGDRSETNLWLLD